MGPNSGIAMLRNGMLIPCPLHMAKNQHCNRDAHFDGGRPGYTTEKTRKSAHNQNANRAVRAQYNKLLAEKGHVVPSLARPEPTGEGGLVLRQTAIGLRRQR